MTVVAYAGMTHLGLVSALAAAAKGADVIGFDPDGKLISLLSQGQFPVVEPGLIELYEKNRHRVRFTADSSLLARAHLLYVAPDVPTDEHGDSDLGSIENLLSIAFAHAVEDAVVIVLSQVPPGFTVRATGAKRLRLFGFSGGGAIAALITARRTDVVQLVTIAGNLDHAAWTTIRKVSPLSASLNPADMASALTRIPQIHFVGKDDTDVPPKVAQSYRSRFSDPSRISIIEVPGVDHDCCWVERWPGLLKQYVYAGAS